MKLLFSLLFGLLASLAPVHALEYQSIRGEKHMVAAASPHATAAGMQILEAGGNAVDAAIAMELVLTLVEPQSSGIGGGGFIMHRLADGTLEAWDGRETAPAGMKPTAFLGPDGSPMGFSGSALGGLPVGVPGMVHMFGEIHREHGKLPWARLFEPAIHLADNGFNVSPRLNYLLTEFGKGLAGTGMTPAQLGAAGSYFWDENGIARPTGYLLRNPEYAATLRDLAKKGAEAFYSGEIGKDIIAALKSNEISLSDMTLEDLKQYRTRKREPVCGSYRSNRICSMGPPSSGATTLLSILGMLEHFDMSASGNMSAKSVHLYAEASKLAYADRELYIGDPAFVTVPTAGLIDPDYLSRRATLVDPERAAASVEAGEVPTDMTLAPHRGYDFPSTTHMTVIDQWGNAVSFTATVQAGFGSMVMSGGFLLNNELTDFSYLPELNGKPVANRVQGGKRPRSSMTPVVVEDSDGELKYLVGSPGGSRIIGYVAKTLIGLIDWDLSMQEAINLPNIINQTGRMELERSRGVDHLQGELGALGHTDIQIRNLNSGLHGIEIHREGDRVWFTGGADPRREGDVKAR